MFLKRISIISLLIVASFFCFAQKDTCKFILTDNIQGRGEYYLASNINQWNPRDENFKFKKDSSGTNFLICYFDKGTELEFKFTKGSWDKDERDSIGGYINNHKIKTDTAKLNIFHVQAWFDFFGANLLRHTLSSNVKIIDTAFYIPQLGRKRKVWIYLPNNYSSTHQHYPVLYMHDGQNLFDEYTSGYGEWGIDECLDTLMQKTKLSCIVVGIDNGGDKRMSEYNPYEFTYQGTKFNAEGDAYVDFLAKTLKPFIDKHYRTLSTKENTIIAGSSMGGVISYYAVLKYPDVFGKAGIFSPAFWTAPALNKLTDSMGNKISAKLFFYMGGLEGDNDLHLMEVMKENIAARSSAMIYSVIDKEGKHNEQAWRKWFPEFYKWIMAEGFNNIIKPDE